MVGYMTVAGEVENGGEIGHEVDGFSAGGGGEKIEAEPADENKNEEAPGARTEEPIIETQSRTHEDTGEPFALRGETWGVELAEVLFPEGVDGDGGEKDENDGSEVGTTDESDSMSA